MKIILLDDVPKLGRRGEVRDVSDGYARNFLLPHKLALNATAANLKNLDAIKARQESQAAKARAESEGQARAIEGLAFTQTRQASDEGKLFGSVGKADIAAFLAQHGDRGGAAAHHAGRAHQDPRRGQRARSASPPTSPRS